MELCAKRAVRQFGFSYQVAITQAIGEETGSELMNKSPNKSGKNESPQVACDKMFSKLSVGV